MTAELPPHPEPARPVHQPSPSSGSNDAVAIIALVAFIVGVLLNGYIAFSILDDESTASSVNEEPIIVPAAPTTEPTPTITPLPDRTDCEEIRGTDYHSAEEREFFLANCTNLSQPTPTPEGTEVPPLDGGTNTEAIDGTPTPEP